MTKPHPYCQYEGAFKQLLGGLAVLIRQLGTKDAALLKYAVRSAMEAHNIKCEHSLIESVNDLTGK